MSLGHRRPYSLSPDNRRSAAILVAAKRTVARDRLGSRPEGGATASGMRSRTYERILERIDQVEESKDVTFMAGAISLLRR